MIEARNFSITYRHRVFKKIYALNNVTLKIEEGDVVGIAGESGCGKSTFARGILKLFNSWQIYSMDGDGFVDGQEILKEKEARLSQIRGKKVAMIFQHPYLSFNPVLKIKKQIPAGEFSPLQNKGEILNQILEKVGLEERELELYPHQLSGGMLQRVQIAGALLLKAKVLIADEPTSSLDAITQKKIINLLKKIVETENLTLIFISHNLRLIRYLTKKTFIFYGGFLVEEGPTDEVFENPLHPYTKALLKCIPEPHKKIEPIPGDPPDLSQKTSKCPFFERCYKRESICEKFPPYRGERRKVLCFYPEAKYRIEK